MPILRNAKKALRASERKATYNRSVKSRVKSALDAVRKSPTMVTLTEAYSALDVSVKKNLMHKNKAARLKSQLAKLVKPTKLAAKPAKAKAATKTKTATKKATKPKKSPAKKSVKKK